jgi:hypothetical protein
MYSNDVSKIIVTGGSGLAGKYLNKTDHELYENYNCKFEKNQENII